jgi:hypothetical protein
MCLFCEIHDVYCCKYYERSKELKGFLLLSSDILTKEETQFCIKSKDMSYYELRIYMIEFLQNKLNSIKPM